MKNYFAELLRGFVKFVFMSLIVIGGCIGCGRQELSMQQGEAIEVSKETAEEGTSINQFMRLKESFIDYTFNIEKKEIKDHAETFWVTGAYDLNQDGTQDQIIMLLRGKDRDADVACYIEVNGIKQEFYMDYTVDGEVRLIDLDKNDSFFEIAIFDEGPSGDPHYKFYRFNGKELYQIGSVDSEGYIDGNGKVLSSFHTSHFEPAFYSAWYEIANPKFVLKPNVIESYLGKTYHFAGGDAFFIPAKEIPKDFLPMWNFEEMRHFEAQEIKLVDVYFPSEDRLLYVYLIELASGERGILYFWIGD